MNEQVTAKEFGAFLMGLGMFVLQCDEPVEILDLVDDLETEDSSKEIVVSVLKVMSENGVDPDRAAAIISDCAVACRGLEDIAPSNQSVSSDED